jgi:hypothetical protein
MAPSPAGSSGTQELPEGTVGVVVPVPYVEVIRTLTHDALHGESGQVRASAARELRAWKEQHPEVNEHVELDEQPAVIRDRLLRRLIAEEQELLRSEVTLHRIVRHRPTITH